MSPIPHFGSISPPSLAAGLETAGASLLSVDGNASTASTPLDAARQIPYLPASLASLARSLPIFASLTVAWFAIVVWDTLATAPLEYRYIWKAKWTLLKFVYFVNRYWTPVCITLAMLMVKGNISSTLCSRIAVFHPIGALITIFACDSILSIRLYALYDKTRTIFWTVILLLAGETIVMVVATSQSEAVVLPAEWLEAIGYYGCTVRQRNVLAPLFWGATLTFETICLVLLLHRIHTLRRKSGPLPILTYLLHHELFYFVVVFVSGVINIILSLRPMRAWRFFNPPSAVAINSLMVSRLVLSLHAHKRELFTAGSNSPGPPCTPASPSAAGSSAFPLSAPSAPPLAVGGDQTAPIPLGKAFSSQPTPSLSSGLTALDHSVGVADAGDLSSEKAEGYGSECGSSISICKKGGRKAFEGFELVTVATQDDSSYRPPDRTSSDGGSIRFIDVPSPAQQARHPHFPPPALARVESQPSLPRRFNHRSSLFTSTSTASSRPRPSSLGNYLPRPSSPPSLTSLPSWMIPRRLSPIPQSSGNSTNASRRSSRNLEGRIEVQRETTVTVCESSDGEGERVRGAVWAGEAL